MRALLGSTVIHGLALAGLLFGGIWWVQQEDPREVPSFTVEALEEVAVEVEVEAPLPQVSPPEDPLPEVVPVVEVEAAPLPAEEFLPEDPYRADRPWMPRGLRKRYSLPEEPVEEAPAEEPVALSTDPAPEPEPAPEPAPAASVVLGPSIDQAQCPAPEYPRMARRKRWEGVTELLVSIGADGRPTAIRLIQSSGYEMLDQAAQKAVEHWRFHPARRDGVAEAGELLVPIRFSISGA